MSIILFEDDHVSRLHPASLGRPAFAISVGSYRLFDLVADLGLPTSCVVRPHLREIHTADFPDHSHDHQALRGSRLLVNARLVPEVAALEKLRALWNKGRPCLALEKGHVVAALLSAEHRLPLLEPSADDLAGELKQFDLERIELGLSLLEYPHDIVRHHLRTLRANIEHRLATGNYEELAEGVFAAAGAQLGQHTVTDTGEGPIVLEAGARVGPHCLLSGPVHIGPGARVIEHAAIKDCVALGHTTKIGGEIEASVVEPYTNKQHHGFLGHSYLGSWINLGAGTCNSDLKNTYGNVNMDYHGERVATGRQFGGCFMGDDAKSAINTGIFTGKTVGACSMLYGFVTTNVPSFVNYARSFGQVTETPVEVMIHTQARMFARRNVSQRPCDAQLLRDMYELTRAERQMGDEPLSF